MPDLFGSESNFSRAAVLGAGEDYLYSRGIILNQILRAAVLSFSTDGSGTFKIEFCFYDGQDWTSYSRLLDAEGNNTFNFGSGYRFNIRESDNWLDLSYGIKILFTRLSGSGAINFSKGVMLCSSI